MEELLPKDHENIPPLDLGPTVDQEQQRFTAEEMVGCEKCQRINPPTRSNCIYCGAPFAFDEERAKLRKPELRPLEEWEQGNTVVFAASGFALSPDQSRELGALLKITPEALLQILSFQRPLPLACTATAEEARLVASCVNQYGLSALIITDTDLAFQDFPALRIRALDISEKGLLAHPSGGDAPLSLEWLEVELLVRGTLLRKNQEFLERKGGRQDGEILDAVETFGDEAVVDLYWRGAKTNLRILAKSFDFSCLGSTKTLLAHDNFRRLVDLIRSRAPHAVMDDSYTKARHALEHVWSSTKITQSRGWRRERPGKLTVGAVTEVSNEKQFTRYSRLLKYLQHHKSR